METGDRGRWRRYGRKRDIAYIFISRQLIMPEPHIRK
jgi:hypothetical protein